MPATVNGGKTKTLRASEEEEGEGHDGHAGDEAIEGVVAFAVGARGGEEFVEADENHDAGDGAGDQAHEHRRGFEEDGAVAGGEDGPEEEGADGFGEAGEAAPDEGAAAVAGGVVNRHGDGDAFGDVVEGDGDGDDGRGLRGSCGW